MDAQDLGLNQIKKKKTPVIKPKIMTVLVIVLERRRLSYQSEKISQLKDLFTEE